ncbi:MAG: phosphotransferase [Clostridia bacterium]|nr:phosphotransferase [Clostridia bacterium]
MIINKELNGNELIIKLDGRLDTNTVSDLEKEISDLNGVEKIIFDFEKLEYISSSGLRCILKCKKMVDSTKIINCSTEVYEIFDMTGFSEMMEIEKALRNISIDNCEKIGEGFFGIIYRIDPETIVKVYRVKDSLDMIKRERTLSRKAFVMGIPTAIPYDTVKVGDLYGAVFELLNAKSIVNLINNEEDLDTFAKKSVEILKTMHQKEVKEMDLPKRKDTVLGYLKNCENLFSKEIFDKLVFLLNTIPDTNTLLHCDFHVKNIMMQNDELLLIDMDTLSIGHPIFEFASIFATYEAFSCVDKQNTDKFLGMPLEVTKKLFDKIFRYYYRDKSDEELESIKLKLSIISYIQVLYLRAKYEDDKNITGKEEIEFCKNYLTEFAAKLDTLEY